MNRLGRISLMLLMGGALLLPFCARSHAQDQDKDQKTLPPTSSRTPERKRATTRARKT